MASRRLSEIQPAIFTVLDEWAGLATIPCVQSLGTRANQTAIELALNTEGIAVVVIPPVALAPQNVRGRGRFEVKSVVSVRYNDIQNNSADGLGINLFEVLEEVIRAIQSLDTSGQNFSISEEQDGISLTPDDEGLISYEIRIVTPITI